MDYFKVLVDPLLFIDLWDFIDRPVFYFYWQFYFSSVIEANEDFLLTFKLFFIEF